MMVLWKQFEVLISILMWFNKAVWEEAVAVWDERGDRLQFKEDHISGPSPAFISEN